VVNFPESLTTVTTKVKEDRDAFELVYKRERSAEMDGCGR
jgi:hypothetical protein